MNYLRCKQQSCQRDIKRLKEREFQLHSELITASQELQRLRLILRDHQSATSSIAAYEGSPVWDRVEESRDLSQRITISHQYLRIDSTTTIFYWATPSDSDTWWIFSFYYSSSIFVSPLASPCPPPLYKCVCFFSSAALLDRIGLDARSLDWFNSEKGVNNPILFLCFIHCWLWLIVFIVIYIYIHIYIYLPKRPLLHIFCPTVWCARSNHLEMFVCFSMSVPVRQDRSKSGMMRRRRKRKKNNPMGLQY